MYLSGAPSNLTGVGAKIEEYSPFYSAKNNAGTNASLMLFDRNTSFGIFWAQLGWSKSQIQTLGTTKRQVFVEWFFNGSPTQEFWPGEPIGNMTKYEVYYSSPAYYDFFMNDVLIWSDSNFYAAPVEYQLFGETHDAVDQMPGEPTNHLAWRDPRYYVGSAYTPHTMAGSVVDEFHTGWFSWSHPSTSWYYIWDLC
jgi:hypothetical protein